MRRRPCAVRSTFPLLALGAPLALAACGVDVARARQGNDDGYAPPSLAVAAFSPAPPARHEAAGESQALDGEDFTLRYPADATLRPLDTDAAPGAMSAVEIRGPELRDSEGEPIEGSSSYSFEVVSYPNPDQLPLDAWLARHREQENGRDALRGARLTAAAGEPTADGPASASVGGLPALRESRFGGDCQLVRYYVARGTRVVALRYADFPVESDSLNPENLRTYGRLMNSFRWKAK